KGIQLMFIPYREEISMGESIEKASLQLKEGMPLIITGHGDWLGGIRSPDPSEPGIYMPLTEADIKRHRPEKVILGHIHRPGCEGNVYYPGSPYPLDINESGKRRFLVLDLKNLSISCREVNTDKIYFNRSIFVFPFKDEPGFLKKEARKIKKSWGLNLNEIKKTRIRLKVKGYSEDRKAVAELLREEFGEYNFYDRGPDISELEYARVNSEKMEITEKLIDYVEGRLDWDFDALSPLKEDIVREALTLVFK
ncbi:MAG: metallophosphoesterase family protein, partial [Elusimicrobiota bacterium]